jgi:hypothetical protein
MSRLDDILDKDFDCISAGFRIHQLTDADARHTKQQVKALMREIYEEAEQSEFDTRGEFFQKVEEL